MGFSYLDGEYWAQVTREERFFCQHLYGLLVKHGVSRILPHIGDRVGIALRQDVGGADEYRTYRSSTKSPR